MEKGYVYFVACAEPDCRKVHPFIKIGQTRTLKNRLSTLQTGSPVALKFVGYIKANNPEDLERYFHTNFQKAWLYGEWYRLSDGMIKAIRQYPIIDDKFDEFFTELPKFEMDPATKAWKDYARRLEEKLSKFTGKWEISCPIIRDNNDRNYERSKVER